MESFCAQWQITNCYNFFKDFTPAFVAVIVGLLAAFFSYRQWRLAREKLRLDLFDKRIKVFDGFMHKVRDDMGDADLTPEQYAEHSQAMAATAFLFPRHIRDEMQAINAVAEQHRNVAAQWRALRDKEYSEEKSRRGELAVAMQDLRTDYDTRIAALPEKLAAIMKFAHITR